MDVVAAYRDVGTYRGAAAICGTTHKTVRRIIEAHEAATTGVVPATSVRGRNYEEVADLVGQKVRSTSGRISAKRLLPLARAAGMRGRPATSAVWSPTRSGTGGPVSFGRVVAARRSGRPGRPW
jgi:hypothetical protein